jgi:hypothetical protein
LTTVASDATWTVHGSYPAACSAGEYVTAIGDTLTCSTPAGTGEGWTFATTTLDYWFNNSAGLTKLDSYVTQAYASSTFYTKLEINAFGYVTQAYASSTYAIAGGAYHDGFSDFVANEHIDWTADQGATNIHAGNIADSFLLNTGDAGTGNYDFGGADFFEIPNGTGPTANDPGEIAHDTTNNQLILDDYVVGMAKQNIWSVTVASTSPAFIGGGLLPIPPKAFGYTITDIDCYVSGGTSKVIAVEDASANSSEDITCGTSLTADDGSITNATYTAGELANIDFGSSVGTPNYVMITVTGTITRE